MKLHLKAAILKLEYVPKGGHYWGLTDRRPYYSCTLVYLLVNYSVVVREKNLRLSPLLFKKGDN